MKGYRVRVTRLDTGEEFPTIRSAAKALHITEQYLSSAEVRKKRFACGIPLKFEETKVLSGWLGRPKTRVKRLDTGEVFEGAAAAAVAIGCSQSAVYKAFRHQRPCKGVWLRRV